MALVADALGAEALGATPSWAMALCDAAGGGVCEAA
jgi:hypothetical protein